MTDEPKPLVLAPESAAPGEEKTPSVQGRRFAPGFKQPVRRLALGYPGVYVAELLLRQAQLTPVVARDPSPPRLFEQPVAMAELLPSGPRWFDGPVREREILVASSSHLVAKAPDLCPQACACPHHAKMRAKLARRAARQGGSK